MNAPQSQYAQALQSLYNQLQESGSGGNVDLANRPRVSPQDMAQVGYDIGNDGYATTYTSTYSNPEGTQAINLTPIQAKNGQMNDIFEQEFMNNYANELLNGRNDDLGLQIGGMYQGNDAIQNASDDAVRQHNLQEQYYALLSAMNNR